MNLMYKYIMLIMMFGFQTSISATQELNDSKQVDSLVQESLSRVYEKPDESIILGLAVYEELSYSINTRTRALMLVSLAYTSKRDYQKALEYINKAEELSIELNDALLQIEILFKTGILYQQLKIYDKSIEFMEKVERQCLLYPGQGPFRRQLANSYIVKGFIYKENLNCDIALEFFDRGIKEYQKIDVTKNVNLSIVHYNKGNCYSLLSEFGNAKNSFSRAIAYAELENANSLISFAQKGLAEVYLLEGQYEQAIELLQIALEKSENVGDLVLNSSIYKGLFENYIALNNWDEYQKYYDLYLATQLELKLSERNSISDSILENSNSQNEKLNTIEAQFKYKLNWIILAIIIFVIIIFFKFLRNKKNIKFLQNKVNSLQNVDAKT